MAAELRWILLGLSLLLLAGIWWWGARRSAQAPGNAQLREAKAPLEAPRAELPAAAIDHDRPEPEARGWVSPFEPLSIHTADYDSVPVLEGPIMTSAEPAAATSAAQVSAMVSDGVPTLLTESVDRGAVTPAPAANSSERQRIVTIRVCAAGEARWSGVALLAAFELHGLAYGRYQVFHRRHVDGRSLFCVASLVEPGTFDVAQMATQEFRGITLFAVLPGPVEPLLTIDELLAAARGLALELSGMVQDAKGMPLSPQRAAALRDDVARFQASLS